jgi:MoaA/NifB/PqqE/SkfB family radical SAM enzyme
LLGVSTIVMRDNVSCLREMTEFLLSLDIDRVMFQPIRPAGSLPVAQWPDCEGWVDDLDALGRGFAYLSERRKTDPRIQVSAKALRDMQRYFADPATPDRARSCGLGYERLVILSNGDIQMCYGEFPPIGNIRNGNIAQVWRSAAAKRCRAAMRGCVAPCPNHIKRELSLADKARKFVFFAKTGLLH